jgi:hypothetical protein
MPARPAGAVGSASVESSAVPAPSRMSPAPAGLLSPAVRLLLWDYARGSLAYDVALLVVVLLLLLVPGSFWGDPLCGR